MATPEFMQTRLPRILERLIERTEANEVEWERGAPEDSYAVNVDAVRFRIRGTRTVPGGRLVHVLEFLGEAPMPPIATGQPAFPGSDEVLERLYAAAKASAPDPFEAVERQLGLQAGADSE
jgi:hypothetical protein